MNFWIDHNLYWGVAVMLKHKGLNCNSHKNGTKIKPKMGHPIPHSVLQPTVRSDNVPDTVIVIL